MTVRTVCLGKPMWASVSRLDCGYDIGVFGGDTSHVGAVSLVDGNGQVQTIQQSTHKDGALSEQWAKHFFQVTKQPVCVRCGVHFDDFSLKCLPAIWASSDELMKRVERMIRAWNISQL